ncbi:MAG: RNA-binding S4 domain-containing protein [Pseudomonadota bacterium]
MTEPAGGKIRLDKWLWYARFFKSRGLAADIVGGGHVRVNGDRVSKPSHAVRPGDVVTFPKLRDIRVIQIDAIGTRRGPAIEAQTLYTDLAPPEAKPRGDDRPKAPAEREPGQGRPTKRDRREIDALRRRDT